MAKLNNELIEMAAAVLMMLIGFILSLSMVIRVLEATYELCIFAYLISLSGLIFGVHWLYGFLSSQREKRS